MISTIHQRNRDGRKCRGGTNDISMMTGGKCGQLTDNGRALCSLGPAFFCEAGSRGVWRDFIVISSHNHRFMAKGTFVIHTPSSTLFSILGWLVNKRRYPGPPFCLSYLIF